MFRSKKDLIQICLQHRSNTSLRPQWDGTRPGSPRLRRLVDAEYICMIEAVRPANRRLQRAVPRLSGRTSSSHALTGSILQPKATFADRLDVN